MTKPYLVPYKAEHTMAFVDRGQWKTSWDEAFAREKGPAFTGMYGDEIIGCAGVAIPWPGFGIVWLQMSPVAALKFKVWMTRTCKRVIEDIERSMNFYRLEAIVVEDNIMNQRWIKALGFKQENGHATHYLPNGTNMIRYERVRNG